MNMNDVKNNLAAVHSTITDQAVADINTLMTDANTNTGQGMDWLQQLYNATTVVTSDGGNGEFLDNPYQGLFDNVSQTLHAIRQINGGEWPGEWVPMTYSGTLQ